MLDMLSSAATSVSARSGDILCGYLHGKTVAPFRFAQPQHVYSKLMRKKQALISLYDKKNLTTLGNGLQESGYTIVSTGGTASTLENAGVSVTKVETLTHFPEMTTLIQLDGRVKTLQPNIHGAFYFLRLRQVICSIQDGIENIDIGGPAMIRAAAKAAATAALGVRNRVKYMLALVPLNQSPFFLCATLHLPKLRHMIGKRTQDDAVKLQKKMEQSVEILKLKISPAVTAEKKGTTMNYRMNRIMNISYNLIT
ncbi:hypothetical protein HID58_091421 [Brassica napus]|uniref:MGS-like domain-containing protein n=1 Tax=Brassica napus TaxID=3708 RepID=A0ABQ7X2D9_BRANA|nr:hypothetical protein HID58_091421 [Brassica napus]